MRGLRLFGVESALLEAAVNWHHLVELGVV
jgi:hypothetical protein